MATAAERSERVMVEHSQPNTHKAFHVGHLRNSCLGIAVSNMQSAAGYPVLDGDLSRRHRHARDQVPLVLRDVPQGAGAEPIRSCKGRWLGRDLRRIRRAAELSARRCVDSCRC